MTATGSSLTTLRARAFAPVDNASLVFFRIAFGLLMTWEVCRYFQRGWIARYWIEPQFFFSYYGFSWIQPWPGAGMYIHWAALGVLALFITAGFFHRLSATLFFLGFTYCFLLDQATYLNHFYLVSLLSFILIFLPAHGAFSLDAWLRPRLRSQTTPAWTLWLLQFQIGVVYFFGGIAKISPDWVRGEPMRSWMARATDFPLLGRFFRDEWAVYTLSYGGLLLDLLIVPCLLWRRTRIPAFAVAVIFHLTNARLFEIGIFPWLAIAATALFLPPDWPRRALSRFRPGKGSAPATAPEMSPSNHPALVLSLLAVYAVIQLLVPLRHVLYPGSVDWTYQGHRFSWRMKLHNRDAWARFHVMDDNSGQAVEVNPSSYVSHRQAAKMATSPDMILQFAHFLREKLPRQGPKPLRVAAHVITSVNGRIPQRFVDPSVDLAAEPRTLGPAPWILPRAEPLPDSRFGNRREVNSDR
ncbi:MAG TPA: HTTM domain-containing protein [Chthoniobacterales bacterium]|nr:HTTM domain-containing protein [Chthoniobacterales bacterium]